MLLAEVVEASGRVGATRSRKIKVEILAEAVAAAEPVEVDAVVAYLSGSLLQRRTGLGWRSMTAAVDPASEPSLTVAEVDAAFSAIAGLSGAGSQAARASATVDLLGRATDAEQAWLRGVVTGAVRQGALDALVQEAVARAGGVPLQAVRRAAMLAGSTVAIARAALTGGEPALAEFRLEVGRAVSPMLASSEPDVAAALARVGGPAAVDTKLDGIRIQAHKLGDEVLLATRTLEDITARLPEVVKVVRTLSADRLVLDGEAIALGPDGRPRPFQETASRTASGSGAVITPYFFDLLHVDGEDLLDRPGSERLTRLEALVPAANLVPRGLSSTLWQRRRSRSTRHSKPGTRVWSSRASPRRTTPVAVGPRG